MHIRTRKQNLKKILEEYSEQELKIYEKYEEMPPHSFSSEYRRKMQELQEQPMQRKKYTFVYRLATVCVCVIVALLIANQTSAYFFGVTLWDKFMESAPVEMVTTIYQEKENGRNKKGRATAGKERVHDIPTEVPEGYELVSQKNGKERIYAKWQSGDNSQLIFSSYGIDEELHIYENEKWEIEETVAIAGYQGKFYANSGKAYLLWDDKKYYNNIASVNMSKEQLLAMAESLYQK